MEDKSEDKNKDIDLVNKNLGNAIVDYDDYDDDEEQPTMIVGNRNNNNTNNNNHEEDITTTNSQPSSNVKKKKRVQLFQSLEEEWSSSPNKKNNDYEAKLNDASSINSDDSLVEKTTTATTKAKKKKNKNSFTRAMNDFSVRFLKCSLTGSITNKNCRRSSTSTAMSNSTTMMTDVQLFSKNSERHIMSLYDDDGDYNEKNDIYYHGEDDKEEEDGQKCRRYCESAILCIATITVLFLFGLAALYYYSILHLHKK